MENTILSNAVTLYSSKDSRDHYVATLLIINNNLVDELIILMEKGYFTTESSYIINHRGYHIRASILLSDISMFMVVSDSDNQSDLLNLYIYITVNGSGTQYYHSDTLLNNQSKDDYLSFDSTWEYVKTRIYDYFNTIT